jgi:hypothetical protein
VDWTRQLEYGESIGLGSRQYRLVDVLRNREITLAEAFEPPEPILGFG